MMHSARNHISKSVFRTLIVVITTVSILTHALPLHAEVDNFKDLNLTLATTHTVSDKDLESGDIISKNDKDELTRSARDNDPRMFGVYISDPTMVYRNSTDGTPIVRFGEVTVNVTDLNGPIAAGEYITSSKIPGKGQKSGDLTGYVIGLALESFNGKNPLKKITVDGKQVNAGQIKVDMGIGPTSPTLFKTNNGLLDFLQNLFASLIRNPNISTKIIRYILAALVALIVTYICLHTLGRNITRGIEAMGRNPLAKVQIQSMIVLNSILIGAIAIGGIILALIIIRF